MVLVWSLFRLEVTPGLPPAHPGHSPGHFKENHWFDPKGRCPGGFWIIPWAAVGCRGMCLPEVRCTVTAAGGRVPQAPAWGWGAVLSDWSLVPLPTFTGERSSEGFTGQGPHHTLVTPARAGCWRGRRRRPVGSTWEPADAPILAVCHRQRGVVRSQHRRERGPGPRSTVRTEPAEACKLPDGAGPGSSLGRSQRRDRCRVRASGGRWRLCWALGTPW